MEIDQERGVIAELPRRAPRPSAPVVAHVAQTRSQLRIHERLIEPETVAELRPLTNFIRV